MKPPIKHPAQHSQRWNAIAYAAFLVAGIAFMMHGDRLQTLVFAGLALVFDPFDQTVTWNARPLYQKIWLVAHLFAIIAGAIIVFFNL